MIFLLLVNAKSRKSDNYQKQTDEQNASVIESNKKQASEESKDSASSKSIESSQSSNSKNSNVSYNNDSKTNNNNTGSSSNSQNSVNQSPSNPSKNNTYDNNNSYDYSNSDSYTPQAQQYDPNHPYAVSLDTLPHYAYFNFTIRSFDQILINPSNLTFSIYNWRGLDDDQSPHTINGSVSSQLIPTKKIAILSNYQNRTVFVNTLLTLRNDYQEFVFKAYLFKNRQGTFSLTYAPADEPGVYIEGR